MELKWSWLGILVLLVLRGCGVQGYIGIYWGRFATQSMVPSVVVDMLLQNGISEVRLYAPSPNVLRALQGSSIGVTVTLPNDFIRRMKYSNLRNVCDWVSELIRVPVNKGVNLTYASCLTSYSL